MTQVPIRLLVTKDDYDFLDEEFQKHKFDLVVYRDKVHWVIEVNYQHGEKITKKLVNIFKPLLKKNGAEFIMIDDWDCETLFSIRKKDVHPSLDDLIDLINAIKKAGVEL